MNAILGMFKSSGKQAFRTREYAALLGKKGYARLVLHRLRLKGKLVLVRKGWWAFPDSLPEAVACEISKPCYISFHSALFLHGLTTQTPRSIQIAVARRTRPYTVFGMKVKEFKVRKKSFNHFFSREGMLLASPEKAFADCLSIPRACPDIIISEVVGKLDFNKIKRLLYSKASAKRLDKLMQSAE